MRAYLQDLRLLKTAGYLWGKLFLGNTVPGWLIALGSVHVQNTKAASVLGSLWTRHRQELRDRHGQTAGHRETTGLFWSVRTAAVCEQASVGIAAPGAKAGEGRQGLLRQGWKRCGGQEDSQEHSLAFAGLSPWPLRGNIQTSEILAGRERYWLEERVIGWKYCCHLASARDRKRDS